MEVHLMLAHIQVLELSIFCFQAGICNENRDVHMGYKVPNMTWGVYYLRTNPDEPYGISTRPAAVDNTTSAGTNGTTSLFTRLFSFLQ